MRDELSKDSVSSSSRRAGQGQSSALWRLSAPQQAGAAAPGSPGGELSEVLTTPARSRPAPCVSNCVGPLQVLAFLPRYVCVSLFT